MAVERVLLAEPRGFCAGVEMAIKALAWMVRSFPPPVYCYHEIVHNRLIVERFEAQGVVFVDDIAEVPPGSPIMLSAHGSAPEVVAAAQARGSYVVDSVCPLVTKVHHEVRVRAGKGYRIVYVGHEGHEEAVGTMAVAPERDHPRRDGRRRRRAARSSRSPSPCSPRRRSSHRDWEGVAVAVRERFPDVWSPGRSDLCFATTNRQSALMALADAVRRDRRHRLGELVEHARPREAGARGRLPARRPGQRRRRAPDDARRRPRSSASRPARRRPTSSSSRSSTASHPADGVEIVGVTDEDEYFPPPRKLRELQAAIETAATAHARRLDGRPPADGRPGARAPATCSPPSPADRAPAHASSASRRSPRRAARRRRPG